MDKRKNFLYAVYRVSGEIAHLYPDDSKCYLYKVSKYKNSKPVYTLKNKERK